MTVSTIDLLLLAGRAVFLVLSFTLAAVAFTRWRHAAREQTDEVLAQQAVVLQRLADLEARVDATNVSISKLGQRVERPQQLASQTTAPSPGYQIAIRLARGGASREELISGCGLSIHEAELIQRLHGPKARVAGGKSAPPQPHAA